VRGKTREFLAEAEDILGVVDRDIMHLSRGLSSGQTDPAVLKRLFRSIHTLKGLSSIFEYCDITRLCHAFEDKLDMLRLGRVDLDERSLEAITSAQALLTHMVNAGTRDCSADEVNAVIEELEESCVSKAPCECTPLDEKIFSSLTEYENYRLRDNMRAGKKVFRVCASFDAASFDRRHEALTENLEKVSEIIATLPSSAKESGCIAFEMLIATDRGGNEIGGRLGDFKDLTVSEIERGSLKIKGARLPLARAAKKNKMRPAGAETMRRNTGTIRVDVEKIESLMGSLDELFGLKARLSRITDEMIDEGPTERHAQDLNKLRARCDEVFAKSL